jgi:hypothetical protein
MIPRYHERVVRRPTIYGTYIGGGDYFSDDYIQYIKESNEDPNRESTQKDVTDPSLRFVSDKTERGVDLLLKGAQSKPVQGLKNRVILNPLGEGITGSMKIVGVPDPVAKRYGVKITDDMADATSGDPDKMLSSKTVRGVNRASKAVTRKAKRVFKR